MCNVHQWVIVTVAAVQNCADTSSPVVTCPLQIRQPKHTNHKPVPPPPTAIYDPPSVGSPLRSENPFSAHAPRIRAHNKLRQGRRDILIVLRAVETTTESQNFISLRHYDFIDGR